MGKLSLLSSIFVITLFLASCGIGGGGTSSKTVKLVDTDGDDVPDFDEEGNVLDLCSPSADKKFVSTPENDYDRDGCKDDGEDTDDDNDNKEDAVDDCEKSPKGFLSGDRTTDYDDDGCKDDDPEDPDDDNDTVNDFNADGSELDKCRTSETSGFISVSTGDPAAINDYDGDGCEDAGEDEDDDNDTVNDFEADGTTEKDKCRTSENSGFISVSTGDPAAINDYDGDGCEDAGEDKDDDDDTVNDFEADGTKLDQCPFAGFNTDDNNDGCEDSTTDTDGDGVNGIGADGSANDKCPFDGFNTDDNNDGCDDSTIDSDNDGVNGVTNGNANDKCINSTGFVSGTIVNGVNNDVDGDGCEDGTDEDIDLDKDGEKNSADDDDDDDGKIDTNDACPRGTIGTVGLDTDNDGCKDTEDVDDDNNGLIEIATADELKNIRYQLDGSRYKESASDQGSNAGCEDTGSGPACKGYELANDIDLLSANFEPITGSFTAILEGNDNTISNLVIVTDANTGNAGFFVILASGSKVRNLSFATGSVTSNYVGGTEDYPNFVGVLAALNFGAISDVSITGISVTTGDGDYDRVGGLVGASAGTIKNGSAAGNVVGGAGNDLVGGLVGGNYNNIQSSSATGTVNGGDGSDYVGGLAGYNGGSIGNSYAAGNTKSNAGNSSVGGLVGGNNGNIYNSYAAGNVTDGSGNSVVGGLVGGNYTGSDDKYGAIIDSYAAGNATGGAGDDYVGGLAGVFSGKSYASNSYVLGDVDGGVGDDNVGYLIGERSGTSTLLARNYYNNEGQLEGAESVSTYTAAEGLGKTSTELKALTADITMENACTAAGGTFSGGTCTIITENACTSAGGDWDTASSTCSGLSLAGWNEFDWDFGTDTQYPSLRSYKTGTDADGNSIQIEGELLCEQPTDFVQCTSNP